MNQSFLDLVQVALTVLAPFVFALSLSVKKLYVQILLATSAFLMVLICIHIGATR